MRRLDYDVVIIGGGAAGCYAALTLKRLGITPVVVSKGFVGKSGASIFAGNLVISGRALGNTEENAKSTAEFLIKYHNQFLIDQDYARRCGKWISESYYPELEEAGLYLRRDDAGNVVVNPGPIRSVAANLQGNSGVVLMDVRRKQVLKEEVPLLEEVAVTALLQDENGAACGVVALDLASGEIFAVHARAVILATGYSDRLHWRSTGTREMSADGIAMAYRLGAELVNLEMQWWHTNDCRYPSNWQRMQVYPNPVLGSPKSARMINAQGEVFFDQQRDDPMAFGPYTVQLKRLVREVRAGKARYDGGYFAGFDHCDAAEIEAHTTYTKLFKQLGLDAAREPVEVAVSAHYRQGGVRLDPATMGSSIPGLFIAGGVGGHTNGLIALVTYDGKMAAESVASYIASRAKTVSPKDKAEAEARRLEALLRPAGRDGVTPAAIKKSIRAIMWDHMGVEKNAAGMSEGLRRLDEIRTRDIARMGLTTTTRRFNQSWVDAVDVLNMLDVCELMIHSALNRKESRGPFIRTDYPDMDNEHWIAENILVPTPAGPKFRIQPYALPYFRPDFARKENLAVAW